MPTHIPWEIEYADEEFPAEEDSAVFTAADTEGQHSMDAYDCSNSTPVEAMTEFDEDMAMLLEIMPQSVLVTFTIYMNWLHIVNSSSISQTLTPGQLDLLMKRLSEDNNVALLEVSTSKIILFPILDHYI